MTLEMQPQHFTFGEMIHGRLFRIPSYQRAYSWQRRQRMDLFEDIQRTWDAGDGRHHFMATIVGLRRERRTIIIDEHQVIDIVDGQQRLTTLILLLKSIAKALDRADAVGKWLGREVDESLVKPDEASLLLLQTNHDTSNHFADYLRNGTTPHPRVATTLADRELLQAIRDCEQFVSHWQQKASVADLLAMIRNRLTFIFYEIGNEAVVYTVFEVLNSRGLDVSHFDRLKSLLMAVVFESDTGNRDELIHEIHGLWGEIYQFIGLRLETDIEALRCAATLKCAARPSKPLSAQDSVEVLVEQSKNSPAKVIETTRWLKSVTEAVVNLASDSRRNTVVRIFQARLLATAIGLRSDLSESEKDKLLRAWESVSFRIYGLMDRDARSIVGDYVRLSWDVINCNHSADELLKRILDIGSGFPVEKVIEDIRGSNWYSDTESKEDLRYFLCRYEEHLVNRAGQLFDNEQWNHIWEASAADSIEHILPQSSGDEEYMHRIGNLVLLPPKLNSQLGDKSPGEKADAYLKTGLLQAQEVVQHLPNWDREAIEKRERELLQWAMEEWSD